MTRTSDQGPVHARFHLPPSGLGLSLKVLVSYVRVRVHGHVLDGLEALVEGLRRSCNLYTPPAVRLTAGT